MIVSCEKKYETKCGFPVKIGVINEMGHFPVLGVYHNGEEWVQERWSTDGISFRKAIALVEVSDSGLPSDGVRS